MPTLTTIIQPSFESPSHGNQRRKKKKMNPDIKEVKFLLFADDMILHIENPNTIIRKLLEIINEFSKVVGYKINTLKSLALLYNNSKK